MKLNLCKLYFFFKTTPYLCIYKCNPSDNGKLLYVYVWYCLFLNFLKPSCALPFLLPSLSNPTCRSPSPCFCFFSSLYSAPLKKKINESVSYRSRESTSASFFFFPQRTIIFLRRWTTVLKNQPLLHFSFFFSAPSPSCATIAFLRHHHLPPPPSQSPTLATPLLPLLPASTLFISWLLTPV